MRMRFDEDDEQAFGDRRDRLAEQFATWLAGQRVAGDPTDAELLMDWKFGYGDGALDRWSVVEAREFLFDWCVGKLSAPSTVAAHIPRSVAAFVEFLDSTGLLARDSDPPAQVRAFCEQNRRRFVRAMKDPANFGPAKGLLGGLDQLPGPDDPGSPAALRVVLVDGLDADDEESAVVGPVRMPAEQEQRDAVRAAAVPRRLRLLAEYCAPPGRPLTGTGNLRLADARHLVAALETGDDPEFGGSRTLTSAQDLPALSWLFELALAAGVVRRARGRLVAVARFAALDEVAAYAKVVRAALTAGLSPPAYWSSPALEVVRAAANDAVVGLLARLLDADDEAVPQDELAEMMTDLLEDDFVGMPDLVGRAIPRMVSTQVERLVALGMVTVDGDGVTLTAAGVPVTVDLVRDAGFEVLLRPDPDTADAAAVAALLDVADEQEWAQDASAWLAAQPDRGAALEQLVETVCGANRETPAVMVGLIAIGTLAGEQAVPAVRRQVGGPHDGLVLNWLAGRSALDPATVDPLRFVSGLVDVLAVALDLGGPEEMVTSFDHGAKREQQLELLDRIWLLDHPRLADVLEAIGAHHPVMAVAKAARRALIRHHSRPAGPSAQRP